MAAVPCLAAGYRSPQLSLLRSASKNPLSLRRTRLTVCWSATANLIAESSVDGLLPVDGEQRLVGNALDADGERGVAAHHDGPQRKQMRTDGRDHQRVHVGGENGAVGGQRVGGGAGGRGDDHAVGAEAGDQLAFKFDGEVAHARDVALGDDGVVERVIGGVRRGAAPQLGAQHGAAVELVAALAPAVQGSVEVGEPHLGEEAEIAEVGAEDGRAGGGKGACGGQERAVAAEHDDQLGLLGGEFLAVDRGRARGIGPALEIEHRLITAVAQPADQLGQQAGELFLVRLANDGDADHAVSV